jgi:ABC-type polysaccharide/polyol phosphate transport system ATPase subunit
VRTDSSLGSRDGAYPASASRRLAFPTVQQTADSVADGPARALQEPPPAVTMESVSKTFRIPHQQYNTLKERALHPFRARTYDVLHAVEDVSLSIRQGEFFGIVGRNGSGKSTLLKCLAGIYELNGGRISVEGRLSPFIELGVGFNPDLAARDNVMVNAIMLGLSRREAKRRFDEIIAFAELEDFVDLKLKNYSSGMSIRLGFSVAIQVDAQILLVDEVLAVGDASFQRKCYDEFGRMREAGKTIVFVTHDMSAVERLCDRAMLLEKGRMLEIGDPDHISRRYTEVNFGYLPDSDNPSREARPEQARVRSVWTENAEGERILSTVQGDTCRVCMEVEFKADVPHPVFSVTFRNDVRHVIFIPSTMQHEPLEPFRAGDRAIVRLGFQNWLAPSRYTLTPAISTWDPDHRVIDQREDLASLIVDGPIRTGAVADLPTELELERL